MERGLTKCSGSALKNVLSKITNNPWVGFLLGLLVTAVIQSSTATIVLAVGLVGAGALTFRQSISVVIGANVGTTATAQIIRLLDIDSGESLLLGFLKPSGLAPIAAVIGIILIMFIKSKQSDNIGEIAMGFGILFVGLMSMTGAVEPLSSSESFTSLMATFSKTPVLGFLSGAVICAIMQSSSATVGMLQALSSTGAFTFGTVYAILIGINVSTCVTIAFVTSIGTKANARRTGMVHIEFNILGSVLIFIVIMILKAAGALGALWDEPMTSGMIANAHTIFKLGEALCLLPFVKLFEKLAYRLVRDDKRVETETDRKLSLLDEKLLMSVPVALARVAEAIDEMGMLASTNVRRSFELLNSFDAGSAAKIIDDEENIDRIADGVENYLVKLSANVDTEHNNDLINYYLQCSSEYERVGDHAANIAENAEDMHKKGLIFSDQAKKELDILSQAVSDISDMTHKAYINIDADIARRIEPLEEVIDDVVALLKERHIDRLRNGQCTVYSGIAFIDVLSNAERAADQCANIAVATLAQHEKSIMHNHREYVSMIHTSGDPVYTAEYNANRKRYYDTL